MSTKTIGNSNLWPTSAHIRRPLNDPLAKTCDRKDLFYRLFMGRCPGGSRLRLVGPLSSPPQTEMCLQEDVKD